MWRDPGLREGRIVSVGQRRADGNFSLEWPMTKYKRLDGWEIVHPAIGRHMRKDRALRNEQSFLTPDMKQLLTMWETALSARAGMSPELSPHCEVCQLSEGFESSLSVSTCPLCLCSWHGSCAIGVIKDNGPRLEAVAKRSLQGHASWLPELLSEGLCCICAFGVAAVAAE